MKTTNSFDSQSGSCREFACDAIGFPIIPYDNDYYKNDYFEQNDDGDDDMTMMMMIANSGKCLNPRFFEALKTLVVLIDIFKIILDYVLVVYLCLIVEMRGYAGLLGSMTSLSLIVSIWMKFLMYGMKKDHVGSPEFILMFVLITELFVFAFETATSIFILTRVDEGGIFWIDHTTLLINWNIWTTIVSGVCIELLLLMFILILMISFREISTSRGICSISPPIIAMIYIGYMLYIAIDKLLLENPTERKEDFFLKGVYAVSMVVILVVLVCSHVIVYYTCVRGNE